MMKVSDFDYDLPKQSIAQHPSEKRDHSKLMILNRANETISHHIFHEIKHELGNNDVLVINDTKVIPARILGIKKETDALIEVLLLKELKKDVWEAMTKPARRVKVGTIIDVGGKITLQCVGIKEEGLRDFKLTYDGLLIEQLEALGEMPLPPYITEKIAENDRYQTVYAKDPKSAAAPTAGLHFTKELLEEIKQNGTEIIPITLHVGLGTFKPVSANLIEEHHMHEETYEISTESAERLNLAKKQHKRIVSVGTTSLRALESNFDEGFHPGIFDTKIFIYPGYSFKAIDALITNFHLPKSTLLMLVSALSNRDFILKAYKEAVDKDYRFFSFGDAMFIK